MKKVFLGGTCNNSTWREELIPKLKKLNIDYFNPVVDNWTPEHQEEEILQREVCDFLLYTITKEMKYVYSIAEVVDDSNKRPEKTIFCYLEEGFEEGQIKSLKAVADMVEKNGAKVFTSLAEVVEYLSKEQLEEESEGIKGLKRSSEQVEENSNKKQETDDLRKKQAESIGTGNQIEISPKNRQD